VLNCKLRRRPYRCIADLCVCGMLSHAFPYVHPAGTHVLVDRGPEWGAVSGRLKTCVDHLRMMRVRITLANGVAPLSVICVTKRYTCTVARPAELQHSASKIDCQ